MKGYLKAVLLLVLLLILIKIVLWVTTTLFGILAVLVLCFTAGYIINSNINK